MKKAKLQKQEEVDPIKEIERAPINKVQSVPFIKEDELAKTEITRNLLYSPEVLKALGISTPKLKSAIPEKP